ncbi:MAG: response regulator [Shimia sp.]
MRRFHLMVVDDDPEDTFALQRAIEKEALSAEVHRFNDGDALLDHLDGVQKDETGPRPDVIFLDINMPGKSGLEVLRAIRSDRFTSAVPVIILTTSDNEADVTEAYASGVNAYVVKPATMGELTAFVRSFGLFWLDCARVPSPSA